MAGRAAPLPAAAEDMPQDTAMERHCRGAEARRTRSCAGHEQASDHINASRSHPMLSEDRPDLGRVSGFRPNTGQDLAASQLTVRAHRGFFILSPVPTIAVPTSVLTFGARDWLRRGPTA